MARLLAVIRRPIYTKNDLIDDMPPIVLFLEGPCVRGIVVVPGWSNICCRGKKGTGQHMHLPLFFFARELIMPHRSSPTPPNVPTVIEISNSSDSGFTRDTRLVLNLWVNDDTPIRLNNPFARLF